MADDSWTGIIIAALAVGGGIILLKNIGGTNITTLAAIAAPPAPTPPTPPPVAPAIRPLANTGGAAAAGVDKFGIKQIYPSANNSWFMPATGKDNRGPFENSGGALKKNPDGSFSWTSNTEIRNEVFSDPGVPKGFGANISHAECRRRGYMFKPNDWKNIEMTGYYFATPGSGSRNGSAHIEHVMRGAFNSTGALSCSASNYHMNIYMGARDEVHLEKDYFHTNGYSTINPKKTGVGAGPGVTGKWFGYKTTCYNNAANTAVTVEAYVDKTGTPPGQWTKVFSFTDTPGAMGVCRGTVSSCVDDNCRLPATYGGPILNFRWDNMTNVKFKWLSCREIKI